MANKNGWWKLEITNSDDESEIKLCDGDREHIAQLIERGYTEGEIVQCEE